MLTVLRYVFSYSYGILYDIFFFFLSILIDVVIIIFFRTLKNLPEFYFSLTSMNLGAYNRILYTHRHMERIQLLL